jgi:hypothetical protein
MLESYSKTHNSSDVMQFAVLIPLIKPMLKCK